MTIASVDRLSVRYGGIVALRDVSVSVSKGETVILVGANGAGKSSLLKSVIGLVHATGGSINFGGVDISGVNCDKRARMGIGYSPEGRRVFKTMTVKENVFAGAVACPSRELSKRYKQLEDQVPLLKKYGSRLAGQLSGGEQQIVAIARAIIGSPKLLLLDEPFLGLSPIWIKEISGVIRGLKERGMGVLLAEQMAIPALKLADRGYILRQGEISGGGQGDDIKEMALSQGYL